MKTPLSRTTIRVVLLWAASCPLLIHPAPARSLEEQVHLVTRARQEIRVVQKHGPERLAEALRVIRTEDFAVTEAASRYEKALANTASITSASKPIDAQRLDAATTEEKEALAVLKACYENVMNAFMRRLRAEEDKLLRLRLAPEASDQDA